MMDDYDVAMEKLAHKAITGREMSKQAERKLREEPVILHVEVVVDGEILDFLNFDPMGIKDEKVYYCKQKTEKHGEVFVRIEEAEEPK